jgi:hypothetical protein
MSVSLEVGVTMCVGSVIGKLALLCVNRVGHRHDVCCTVSLCTGLIVWNIYAEPNSIWDSLELAVAYSRHWLPYCSPSEQCFCVSMEEREFVKGLNCSEMLRPQWIRADWQCSNCGNTKVRDVCQGLLSFHLWHFSRFIYYVQYPTIINNLRYINSEFWTFYFEFCILSKRRLEFHTVTEEVYRIFSKTSFGWQPCQVVKWGMNQCFQNRVCSCCEGWFLKC